MRGNRLPALDAGRTLAILGVIAVHLSQWLPGLPAWLRLGAGAGQYGVQLFFVISAVTICATLEEDQRSNADERDTLVRRFYIKRFFRIAPLYYFSIAIYALCEHFARSVHGHVVGSHSFSDVLANVVFIHGWVPTAINSVVPGGWSIGVEMFFYLIAPLLFFACRTRRGLLRATVAVAICSVTFMLLGACTDNAACRVDNNSFLYDWPPAQLPCFIVGIWLWRYGLPVLSGDAVLARGAALGMAVGCALALVLLAVVGVGMELAHWAAPTVAAFASAALLMLLTRVPASVLKAPLVSAFGRNSYGIYIWHFVAVNGVRAVFHRPHPRKETDKGAIRSVRRFLTEAGITP